MQGRGKGIYYCLLFVVSSLTLFQWLTLHSTEWRAISEWWIGKNVEGSGSGLILRYYPCICLNGAKKTTRNLSQDRQSPGRDMNLGPPEYKAAVLTIQPRCLVLCYFFLNFLFTTWSYLWQLLFPIKNTKIWSFIRSLKWLNLEFSRSSIFKFDP
jgi:hypothetical protein